jgi:hypothetical protein
MSTFWAYEKYQLHSDVLKKLIYGTIQLIEDLITNSSNVLEIDKAVNVDTEGIDLLTESILVGIQSWIRRNGADDAKSECWFENFAVLIKLLRGHVFTSYFLDAIE